MHFYNNFRKECLRHGHFDMTPYGPYPLMCFVNSSVMGN